MAYAELAALRPRAGGEYVYLREAFGPLPAFLTGWTSFVAGFSGAIAVGAVGFASYLGRLLPAAGDTEPWAALPLGVVTLSVSPQAVVALAVIGVLTAVHLVGLGPGRVVQNLLAVMKVTLLAAFVALGFALGRGLGGELRGDRRGGVRRLRLAARAAAGHVRVLGLERRVLPRRGDPRPGPQRAAGPGAGDGRGRGALRAAEPALRLRPARHRVRRRRPHGRRGSPSDCSARPRRPRSPPRRR